MLIKFLTAAAAAIAAALKTPIEESTVALRGKNVELGTTDLCFTTSAGTPMSFSMASAKFIPTAEGVVQACGFQAGDTCPEGITTSVELCQQDSDDGFFDIAVLNYPAKANDTQAISCLEEQMKHCLCPASKKDVVDNIAIGFTSALLGGAALAAVGLYAHQRCSRKEPSPETTPLNQASATAETSETTASASATTQAA